MLKFNQIWYSLSVCNSEKTRVSNLIFQQDDRWTLKIFKMPLSGPALASEAQILASLFNFSNSILILNQKVTTN